MQAIEFETITNNGTISIPKEYQNFFGKPVKVIVLAEEGKVLPKKESKVNPRTRAFFEKIQIDLTGYHFDREEANER